MTSHGTSSATLVLTTLFVGAFAMGCAEMQVVGLVDLIASDLHVSLSSTGALVTANAIGLAAGGPLLTFLTTRLDRRTVVLAHDDGRGVDRRSDREIHDPVAMRRGAITVRDHEVPRVLGQRPERHAQWSWGGRAAISGWSFGITPTFAAPPGDPMSSKNSTFAL